MDNELITCALAIRKVKAEERSIEVTASTAIVDSYGDIVEQTWDLERYNANPVVLYGHDSDELPIGHASGIGVQDGKLQATLNFVNAEANPLAEKVWNSIQQKSLRAVSVGFLPKDTRWETRDGKEVYVMANNELHEISVVPVPANREALMRLHVRSLKSPPRGDAASPPQPPEGIPMNEFLTLAAKLGIAAPTEEAAKAAILALADEGAQTRQSLGTKSAGETVARIAELVTAGAELPKVTVERDALRAEKEASEKAERDAYLADLFEQKPHLKDARAAIEAFANSDWCKFKQEPAFKIHKASPREAALTQRQVPQGGTPEGSVIEMPIRRSHADEASDLADELVEKSPEKYAGEDGYERALMDASRQLKRRSVRAVRGG